MQINMSMSMITTLSHDLNENKVYSKFIYVT